MGQLELSALLLVALGTHMNRRVQVCSALVVDPLAKQDLR